MAEGNRGRRVKKSPERRAGKDQSSRIASTKTPCGRWIEVSDGS